MVEHVKEVIEQAFADCKAYVVDPENDGVHLEAVVVSSQFEGKSLVDQHRMVMNALKDEFASALHALKLKTFTPDQWDKVQNP